jgi:uncharacterized membrane protein
MQFRSWRERAIQSVCFEALGIVLAAPIYGLLFGRGAAESFGLTFVLALAVLICAPLHNAAFDWVDWRINARSPSDRPTSLRVVHAVTHETSAMLITLPLIVVVGGHGWIEAILIDLGFSAFYAGYALVFYWAWDLWRPVAVPS